MDTNWMVKMSFKKNKTGKIPILGQYKLGFGHRDRQDKRPSLSVSKKQNEFT